MNGKILAPLFLLVFTSVACVKKESKKVNLPDFKKISSQNSERLKSLMPTKSGFRCDLIGTETKEVFMEISKKEGVKKVTIRDFESASQVSILGATIEGFRTISFEMEEKEELDEVGNKILEGTSHLIKTEDSNVTVEGSIITSDGLLIMDEQNNAKFVLTHLVKDEDGNIERVSEENTVTIENCEPFEASTF